MDITVFGQTMKLRSGENESYVRTLADYLNGKIAEIPGSKNQQPKDVVILVALNIADELFKTRTRHEDFKRRVKQKTTELLSALDRQLAQA